MKIINGKLQFELTSCISCQGKGTRPAQVKCPACNGTRRGIRGGRNSCKKCYDGRVNSQTATVPCGRCKGTGTELEDDCSYITKEQFQSLPFRVIRDSHSHFGFNESYLGYGYVFTSVDYGRAHSNPNDDEIIADVKKSSGVQACRISQNGVVCDYVAIIVTKQGYKVRAIFDSQDPTVSTEGDKLLTALFGK